MKVSVRMNRAVQLLNTLLEKSAMRPHHIGLLALIGVLEHAHAQAIENDDAAARVSADSVSEPEFPFPVSVGAETEEVLISIDAAMKQIAQENGELHALLAQMVEVGLASQGDAEAYEVGPDGVVSTRVANVVAQVDPVTASGVDAGTLAVSDAAEETVALSSGQDVQSSADGFFGASDQNWAGWGMLGLVTAAGAAGFRSGGDSNGGSNVSINNAPTAIGLSASTVSENAVGAVIGQLTVTDLNVGDVHTYRVDDIRFEVVDGQLKLKEGVSLDHEAGAVVNVTVTAIDAGGLSTAQSFSIDVSNVNEAPSAVALAASSVAENAVGTVIGTLTASDIDTDDTHTYSIDDARFEVVAGQVKLKEGVSLDHEARQTVNITVTATDAGGLSKAQSFAISVTDVAETSILTGTSAADMFSHASGLDDFIITAQAGNDQISTSAGNDIVRPGEGADTVNTGAGNDIVVVVGKTSANRHTQSDITNPGSTGINLSSLLTLADLNGRTVSEVQSGESIDGGAGVNRLVIYGDADLTGVTLANIAQFQVNSDVTVTAQQLNALPVKLMFGDGKSILNITNAGSDPVVVDLSSVTLAHFRTLNIGVGVTLIVDQADVESLHYIAGDGVIRASTTSGTLNLTGKYLTVSVQDKDGNAWTGHGGTEVSGELLIGVETGETLTGGDQSDRIEGGADDDILVGGNGDDILRGGAGVDSMDGGAGDDKFIIVGDLSGGGKIDSPDDTAALGFPLTDLNGKNLDEDAGGAFEIIRGGEGDDTLYVYGAADLSNFEITGIEHIEVRSFVPIAAKFFQGVIDALKYVSVTGDGSSTISITGGTAAEPIVIDLTSKHVTLDKIGHLSLGKNVILKVSSAADLGGARILTGEGTIEFAAGANIDLAGYTITKSLTIKNPDGSKASGGDVIDSVIKAEGGAANGTDGDDYLVGTAVADTLTTGAGTDLLIGNAGDDTFFVNGAGKKIILDSSGIDTLDLSKIESGGAHIDLSVGGTAGDGAVVVELGSGSAATSKTPLDLFIVEDLSGSFYDDVRTVRSLLDGLVTDIRAMQPDSRFGAGSFVDKPTDPFGVGSDYVYRTDSSMSADPSAVKAAFDKMTVLNGNDGPESQLEALYQIALRTIKDDQTSGTTGDEIGFRSSSMRIVVLATDAEFHQAGDHAGAGVNNGDTVLDGTPPGTGEDYPSIDQVKAALLKANIYPVFAITGGAQSTYQSLVDALGVGDVVNLSYNSSDLVKSITAGLVNYKADFIENLVGTDQSDVLAGNSLDNKITGGSGDDSLTGVRGNDSIDGGDGTDTAIFSGTYDEYDIKQVGVDWQIKDKLNGRDGVDVVSGVEKLQFSDQVYTLPSPKPVWDSVGYYKFFAMLSSAVYIHTGIGDEPMPMQHSAFDVGNYQKLAELPGFKFITASELGIKSSGSHSTSFVQDVIFDAITPEVFAQYNYQFSDDGFYGTDELTSPASSFALVAKSNNALFLTFRGTDQNWDWVTDFTGMHKQYAMYEPLLAAVDSYLALHPEMNVYVSGHSLGGQMATLYMNEHYGDDRFHAVVFEAANKLIFDNDGILINYDNQNITNTEMPWDPVPDLGINRGNSIHVALGSSFIPVIPFAEHPLSEVFKVIDGGVDTVSPDMTGSVTVDGYGAYIRNASEIDLMSAIDIAYPYDESVRGVVIHGSDDGVYTLPSSFLPNNPEPKLIILADDEYTNPDDASYATAFAETDDLILIGNGGKNSMTGGGGADHIFGAGDVDVLRGNNGDDFLYGGGYKDIMIDAFPVNPPLSSKEVALMDNNIHSISLSNDVSYLIGGAGRDTLYGSTGDNDYFFIDIAKTGDNSGNVDKIYNFYVSGTDPTSDDWLVFSADQLNLSVDYMKNTLGWDEGTLDILGKKVATYNLDLDAGGVFSSEHWFKVDGIQNYKVESYKDAEPAFVLDYKTGDLYFDFDGDRDVGDQILVANLVNSSGDHLGDMHANQILVIQNFDLA